MPQVPKPEWLGSFFGDDLDFTGCEIRTIQNVPQKELKQEARLMSTKWFDYRLLHPLQATYYFAECYNRAYGRFMEMGVDCKLKFMKGFKGKDFLESKEKLSFWRLRQVCDSIGMRYEFLMLFAMNWYFARGWKYPPRPSHIKSNDDLLTDAMLAWEEEQRSSIQFAKAGWFSVQSYFGHEDQKAYEDFIVEQINQRQHKQFSLNAALYIKKALRIERAIIEFDRSTVEEAIDLFKAPAMVSHN